MRRGFSTVVWVLLLSAAPVCGQGIITTVAGSQWVFRGDGGPANSAPLGNVLAVAVDRDGNVFAPDACNYLVFKITPAGTLFVVTGNGLPGFSGDGGPATRAALNSPSGVAVDSFGNIFIADTDNHRVRKVSRDGNINTVAGTGVAGSAIDGILAISAPLNGPRGLAVDSSGTLYIADSGNHRVRKVTPDGRIFSVAGNGSAAYSGDGGPAVAAGLVEPVAVAVDAAGNVYIADKGGHRVRRVGANGLISTFAGTGSPEYSGDSMPASRSGLNEPSGVATDAGGNVYIADSINQRVRVVDSSGTIQTLAFWVDFVSGVAVDWAGNVYAALVFGQTIQKIELRAAPKTVAGNGQFKYSGDGYSAIAASLNVPDRVAVGPQSSLYIADTRNQRVRKVDGAGTITLVAGAEVGRPLFFPNGVLVDPAGNLYVADGAQIHKLTVNNNWTVVAGTGQAGYSGDGGPAVAAKLNGPRGMALDSAGNLYVADFFNHAIRKISPDGIIRTVAGNGLAGYSGDGGPATAAKLCYPGDVIVSGTDLVIADTYNNMVRRVDREGIISTLAGGGQRTLPSDTGPATSVALIRPSGLALISAGELYISDEGNNIVRKMDRYGNISTVIGQGPRGFSGDAGPASQALLASPIGLALDALGNLYIADSANDRVRKVLSAAPSFAVAPSGLIFWAFAGAPAVASQQVAVASTATGLTWSAQATTASGGNWLSISPAAGWVPGTIAVSVDVSSLAVGTYRGTVTVTAPQATQPTQTVAVLFLALPGPEAQLALEPSSLTFEAQAGGDNPAAQTLRISNAGTGTLAWTAEWHSLQAGQWLSLSQTSGSASAGSPASVQVKVTASGLAAGAYSGSIRVDSSTTGATVTVPVTLLISQVTQTILVSQSGLLFTGVQGADSAPSQSFGILNTGQGVMSWTVRSETLSGGSWLRLSPSSGRTDANSLEVPQVDVSVSVAGLRAGQYSGLIRIESPGANNSPQYVSVELTVLPTGSNPGVLVRPTGLIFAARASTSSPSSQTVRLATAAPGRVGTVGGLLTYDGGAWLQALPTNLVLSPADPRNIVIQPGLGSLAPAIYRATLTLMFDDGSAAQTVNILFRVVGAGARAAAWRAGSETDGACVPTRLDAVHRTLGSSFSAPASWPSPIEVQVMDDCGTAVPTAMVVASFTNGDPPLALTSLRNGAYIGTWRPVNTATQVVVTVRASLPPLVAAEIQARGAVGANAAAPALNSGGIVNGASFAPAAPLAPGSIVSVFGANLASTSAGASSLPLPKTLAGATLQVGGYEVPLFYSSGGQINAQLPFELALNTRPQLIVKGAAFVTVPETITVAAARPGIFTTSQDGKGQGVIMDVANHLVDSANPAKAGDVVVVYCTGLGATTPAVRSGEAAPTTPLARVVMPVSVTIGGQPASVQFAGLTPGYAGLYQVNVQIPAGVSPAASVPLVVFQDGVPSNTVALAVR